MAAQALVVRRRIMSEGARVREEIPQRPRVAGEAHQIILERGEHAVGVAALFLRRQHGLVRLCRVPGQAVVRGRAEQPLGQGRDVVAARPPR